MSKLPKNDLDCYWSATGRAESTCVNPFTRPLNWAPEYQKTCLRGSVYFAPYVALLSHFSWQAQLDMRFSPTLKDNISDIPFILEAPSYLGMTLRNSISYPSVSPPPLSPSCPRGTDKRRPRLPSDAIPLLLLRRSCPSRSCCPSTLSTAPNTNCSASSSTLPNQMHSNPG